MDILVWLIIASCRLITISSSANEHILFNSLIPSHFKNISIDSQPGRTDKGWRKINGGFAVCDKVVSHPLNWLIIEAHFIQKQTVEITIDCGSPCHDLTYGIYKEKYKVEEIEVTDMNLLPVQRNSLIFIKDKGVCINITSIKITQILCPAKVNKLVKYPEGIYGADPYQLQCVANAQHKPNFVPFTSSCQIRSKWGTRQCYCKKGYHPDHAHKTCKPCDIGKFKAKASNDKCQRCPKYSYSANQASTTCRCMDQYIKDPHSSELKCIYRPRIISHGIKNISTFEVVWKTQRNHTFTCSVFLRKRKTKEFRCKSPQTYRNLQLGVLYTFKICSQESFSFSNLSCVTFDNTMGKIVPTSQLELAVYDDRQTHSLIIERTVKRLPSGNCTFYLYSYSNGKLVELVRMERAKITTKFIANYSARIGMLCGGDLLLTVETFPMPIQSIQKDYLKVLLITALSTLAFIFILILIGLCLIKCLQNYSKSQNEQMYQEAMWADATRLTGQFIEPSRYDVRENILNTYAKDLNSGVISLYEGYDEFTYNELIPGFFHNNGKPVFCKRIPLDFTKGEMNCFLQEAAICCQFSHVNVLMLHGIITNDMNFPWTMVMEFASNGTFLDFVVKREVKLPEILHMVQGVVRGMQYFSAMAYVHKVLTVHNVLITENNVCKIAGFGQRAAIDEYGIDNVFTDTDSFICIAPEVLKGGSFSIKSDVYSFGILLWILLLRNSKYSLQSFDTFKQPEGCPSNVYALMVDCWHINPSDRPSFSTLLVNLVSLIRCQNQWYHSDNSYVSLSHIPHDTATWLKQLRLSKYYEKFGQTPIHQIITFTDDDFKKHGVNSEQHRRIMLSSLSSERKTLPLPPPRSDVVV